MSETWEVFAQSFKWQPGIVCVRRLPHWWSSARFPSQTDRQTELPRRWSRVRFSYLQYRHTINSPLIIAEIFVAFIYRQNFRPFNVPTELPRPCSLARFLSLTIRKELPPCWSSARFSSLNCPLLYGQNYLAADHQRDFRPLDRITSPLIIKEISVPYYTDRISLAADHQRDIHSFNIQTEYDDLRRWFYSKR